MHRIFGLCEYSVLRVLCILQVAVRAMELSGSQVGGILKGEWTSVLATPGGQYVNPTGTHWMPQWSADS